MPVKKIKVALIGVRGYGEKIASAILKSKNLELFSCFHPQWEVAVEYGKKYGCLPFSKLEEMLSLKQIEAAVIATPNHLHYKHMKVCLKNKKNIFVEKPITNDLKTAKTIITECKRNKKILFVGHNFRRNGAIRKIKELMEKNKIGEFVSAEINLSHAGGMKLTEDNWRYWEKFCPGGPLMMLGIHAADISNFLFGPAKQMAAFSNNLFAPIKNIDTGLMLLKLKSGKFVYICDNYNTPATFFVKVYGTKGILEYSRNFKTLTFQGPDINRKAAPVEFIKFQEIDTILEELEEFGKAVLNKKKPETGGREAYNALAVIKAAIDSSKKNKFINISHL
jgi:predicted dehydrogenase